MSELSNEQRIIEQHKRGRRGKDAEYAYIMGMLGDNRGHHMSTSSSSSSKGSAHAIGDEGAKKFSPVQSAKGSATDAQV